LLGLFQGILGQIANQMWFEGKQPTFWPDKIHWYFGRLIILLSIVNIFLGLDLFGAELTSFLLYAAFVLLTIIFFIYLQVKVGQQGEYQPINDPGEQKERETIFQVKSAAKPTLFLIYFVLSGILLGATLFVTLRE